MMFHSPSEKRDGPGQHSDRRGPRPKMITFFATHLRFDGPSFAIKYLHLILILREFTQPMRAVCTNKLNC